MLFVLVSSYLNFSYYCTLSFQGISKLGIKNILRHLWCLPDFVMGSYKYS